MCLPNGISIRLMSIQFSFGTLASSCSIVCSGVFGLDETPAVHHPVHMHIHTDGGLPAAMPSASSRTSAYAFQRGQFFKIGRKAVVVFSTAAFAAPGW
jgi:hypothetical protein